MNERRATIRKVVKSNMKHHPKRKFGWSRVKTTTLLKGIIVANPLHKVFSLLFVRRSTLGNYHTVCKHSSKNINSVK